VTATTSGTAWCLFGTAFRELEMTHPDIAEVINATAAERDLAAR
jgi:hypothetical protein